VADKTAKIILTAENRTGPAFASVKQNLGEVGAQAFSTAATMRAAFAGVAASGLIAMAKNAIDTADGLNDLSEITGVSVENLSGLSYAAQMSGTDLDGVAKAVGRFSRFASAANDPTSAQAEKLRELGITAKDPKSALLQLADVFQAMPDGMDKSALAMELFGKSGLSMIPLLNNGSKAMQELIDKGTDLSGVTTEFAKQAGGLNDTLDELKAVLSGAFAESMSSVVPIILEVAKALQGNSVAADSAAESHGALKTSLEALVITAANVWYVLETVGRTLGGIAASFTIFFTQGAAAEREFRKQFDEDNKNARLKLDEFEKRILNPPKAPKQTGQTDAAKQVLEEQKKTAEAFKKSTEASKKSTESQIKDAEALRKALTEAYLQAGKTAEDYYQKAQSLRDKANAKPAPAEDDVEGQAMAMLDLIAAEQKLQRIKNSAPLEDVQAQAEQVRKLAEAIGDKARASEAARTANLAEADAFQKAGDAAKAQQQAIGEQQAANNARINEMQTKLALLEKGVSVPVQLDTTQAQAAIQGIIDAIKNIPPATAGKADLSGVPGFATGTILPGYGGGDRRLILAEDGEAITRKEAVAHYGRRFMSLINNRQLPRFAEGGFVGNVAASAPATTINLTLPGMGTYPVQAAPDVARMLQQAVQREALKRGGR